MKALSSIAAQKGCGRGTVHGAACAFVNDENGHSLPDMGAVLAGAPHPAEKEIRMQERAGEPFGRR